MKNLQNFLRKNWPIVTVLLLAFLLRLPLLSGSFWLDEAAQALESNRPFSEQLQIVNDFQPPLLHYIVHCALYFGKAEWWLRWWAAFLPGLLTIWYTYLVGKKLFNEKVGLIAALLLSTSSFHIFFSQELRPYSLPALWASVSWYLLLCWQEKEQFFSGKVMGFAAASLLGLYSSYLYPFVVISQVLFVLFFEKKKTLNCLMATTLAGVGFLPWLPMFFTQLQAGQSLRENLPGWENVVSFTQFKSLALTLGKFLYGVLDLELHIFFIASFIVVAVCTGYLLYVHQKNLQKHFRQIAFLLAWSVLPIFLAWMISFLVPVIQPKRVLFSLPAVYLTAAVLIAFGFEKQKNPVLKKVSTVFLILLLSLNMYSTFSYFMVPKYQRENWRGMYFFITTSYSSQTTTAVFAFPAPFASWEWYNQARFPSYATGVLTTAHSDIANLKKVTEFETVLVFDYLRDITDPQNKIASELQKYGYVEVDTIRPTTPMGFVRVFKRKTATVSQVHGKEVRT